MAPSGLRVEYLKDPMGVEVPHPRMFWRLELQTGRGAGQSAYQILVSKNPALESGEQWDSGRCRGKVRSS